MYQLLDNDYSNNVLTLFHTLLCDLQHLQLQVRQETSSKCAVVFLTELQRLTVRESLGNASAHSLQTDPALAVPPSSGRLRP